MNDIFQVIISFATLFGAGGVIGGYIMFRLNKAKDVEFKLFEQKHARYKSTLIFMDAYLKPNNISYLRQIHEALNNKNDTFEWLIAEYHDMILYASVDVVKSVRDFIDDPSKNTFSATLLAMRNDLWINKKDLSTEDIDLSSRER